VVAVDLDIVGECAAITGRRSEVAQELLGCGVEQSIPVLRKPLSARRVLRKPFQRMCGQGRGGVEAATDDQAEIAENFQIRGGLAVDSHL